MITAKDFIEYASVGLVIGAAGLAGHFASEGMNLFQWAGAAAAVLGSITLAVAVRVWSPAKAGVRQRD